MCFKVLLGKRVGEWENLGSASCDFLLGLPSGETTYPGPGIQNQEGGAC